MNGEVQKIKKKVFCRLLVEGVHSWPDCNIEEVAYLKSAHRHVFHIKAIKEVYHDDRDVEFIWLGHRIAEYLKQNFYDPKLQCHNFVFRSCETISTILLENFGLQSCEVSEDGENGAVVSIE